MFVTCSALYGLTDQATTPTASRRPNVPAQEQQATKTRSGLRLGGPMNLKQMDPGEWISQKKGTRLANLDQAV
ncbi:hypothetical protein N7530_003991 [Penicillium desertorum]|uniref:Uncharacterized protein n=1 Tax=Penicillium desertorum TaxID=1303715 RepID=A0A9W9WXK6_9EURO|nr:hypothetical protein N7530_003991 [Penicillium desertorum]